MRENYSYYLDVDSRAISAVSTFAGIPIIGVAKCKPDEKFSFDLGKALAAAKCNKKIAIKREKYAKKKLKEATNAFYEAYEHYIKMMGYAADACTRNKDASKRLEEVLEEIDRYAAEASIVD